MKVVLERNARDPMEHEVGQLGSRVNSMSNGASGSRNETYREIQQIDQRPADLCCHSRDGVDDYFAEDDEYDVYEPCT